jgi:hypothetical protein
MKRILIVLVGCLACDAGQTAAPPAGPGPLSGSWVVALTNVVQTEDPSEQNCTVRQLRLTLSDSQGTLSGTFADVPTAYCEHPDSEPGSDFVTLHGGPISGGASGPTSEGSQDLHLILGLPQVGKLDGSGKAADFEGTGTLVLQRTSGQPVPVQFDWRAFR